MWDYKVVLGGIIKNGFWCELCFEIRRETERGILRVKGFVLGVERRCDIWFGNLGDIESLG